MKTIIAGSRWLLDISYVEEATLWAPWPITEVVCGMAPGVDMNGFLWAARHGIPVREFPAAWRDKDGVLDKGAGFRRNEQMARYAKALVAVWDGESAGTADMLKRAAKHGLLTSIFYPYR